MLTEMPGFVVNFVLLLVLLGIPSFSCSLGVAVDILPTGEYEYPNDLHKSQEMRINIPRRTFRYVDILVAKAVVLVVVFLIVRCASYIYEVSRFPKEKERRLATSSACGGEVG